jgi:hypothetical protein
LIPWVLHVSLSAGSTLKDEPEGPKLRPMIDTCTWVGERVGEWKSGWVNGWVSELVRVAVRLEDDDGVESLTHAPLNDESHILMPSLQI